MPSKGTYALVLHLEQDVVIRVGQLGEFTFDAGYYCYVGSARGPGGIEARVRRHLRGKKRPHWHVDYLLERAQVVDVWQALSTAKMECVWARALLKLSPARVPVCGFGSSDCDCPAHLLFFEEPPSIVAFRAALGSVHCEDEVDRRAVDTVED